MLRFQVLRTILDAYTFVWRERQDFLSLAFPAIVALGILSTLLTWLAMSAVPTGEGKGTETDGLGIGLAFGGLVLGVVSLGVWVMFAVAWHRRYLFPDEATTVRAALRWSRRQTRFLLLAIGVSLVAVGIGLLVLLVLATVGNLLQGGETLDPIGPGEGTEPGGAGVSLFGVVISWLPMSVLVLSWFVYARLSMLFPSTAVDHRMSFRECWQFTRGNGWRLGFIIALVAIPVSAIASLLSFLIAIPLTDLGLSGSLTAQFVGALIDETLAFIGIAVGVSALSIAYRGLMAGLPAVPPA